MSDNVTINRNPALGTSFRMTVQGLESFNYFVQEAAIPGMTMDAINSSYRNQQMKLPNNRIDYEIVPIEFIVSEDFSNHTQMRLWMHRIAKGPGDLINEMKDVTLHVLNSNKNSILRVVYFKAFPTGLTAIPLRSSVSDVEPLICTLSLGYQYYDVLPPT